MQQPEMRRSGRDPLVQDSAENRAPGAGQESQRRRGQPVPEAQTSPYGPKAPANRRLPSEVEVEPEPE
ncbi:hypothetical protein [Rugosimonospora acidiphila]|uniref:hypothetical protein n=1 Tax=Rugosimonospora acidiphila TaxID=556531 RepID=UPI0031E5F6AE